MLERTPDYFENFHCLAGACPRSCCTGWEVVIDDVSAADYAAVPGELGQKLRKSLREADGELYFALENGRCPFLDAQNLCELYRELGEERLSCTCRLHPRFAEEYGPLRETSLSASCPAAAALLLGSRESLTFPERRTKEPEEPGDPWLPGLLTVRQRMLALLGERERPLARRLSEILLLALDAQLLLDEERAESLPALCAGTVSKLPEDWDAPGGEALFPAGVRFLESLEILEGDWLPLLQAAEKNLQTPNCPDWALERICAYFLFRFFLKAVNDGDLLGQTQLCLFSALTVRRLSAQIPLEEALCRYCREIEHSEENLTALRGAFFREESMSWMALLRELKTV